MSGILFTRIFLQGLAWHSFNVLGLLHNGPALPARFHGDGRPPWQEKEEEFKEELAEYRGLVDAAEGPDYLAGMLEVYAEVVQHSFLDVFYRLLPRGLEDQSTRFAVKLSKATARLRETANQAIVSQELQDVVALMWPGSEAEHLKDMMSRIDHRGSDIQLWVGQADRVSAQLAPCAAFLWDWRVVEAYPWSLE